MKNDISFDNENTTISNIDLKFLNFIRKREIVHINEILKKFPNKKYSTYHRIDILKKNTLILEKFNDTDTTLGIERNYTECFSISKKGLKTLSDYNYNIKLEKFKTFKTSFLYPISSAIITSIITAYFTTYFILK